MIINRIAWPAKGESLILSSPIIGTRFPKLESHNIFPDIKRVICLLKYFLKSFKSHFWQIIFYLDETVENKLKIKEDWHFKVPRSNKGLI